MMFVPFPIAAYCAAAKTDQTNAFVKSSVVEKSIDMIIEIPQQIHIQNGFRRKVIYTKMYNTAFMPVPDTDTFIKEIKKEYEYDMQLQIKQTVQDVSDQTGCPIDLIGYSVTFREPIMFYKNEIREIIL